MVSVIDGSEEFLSRQPFLAHQSEFSYREDLQEGSNFLLIQSLKWRGDALLFDEKLSPEELDLARLIVTTLGMDLDPTALDPRMPLYGDGMGLDSIDILEISLAISKSYGFRVSADDSDNARVFSSLRNLNEYVQKCRAEA